MKRPPAPAAEPPAAVAVVVPVLNEAEAIGPLLDALAGLGFAEVVVADGGSTDGTPELARRPGVTVVAAPRGRGPQQNAGVRACTSDALLFLHADSLPPPDAPALIRRALADPRVAGGCFRTRFDARHPLLALYAVAGRLETRWTSFGDQGFFMRRSALQAADGFPDWPFLEDVELRRRLRCQGRFVKLDACVLTSARRYLAEGVLRRQWLNCVVLLRFFAGARSERLARHYRAR